MVVVGIAFSTTPSHHLSCCSSSVHDSRYYLVAVEIQYTTRSFLVTRCVSKKEKEKEKVEPKHPDLEETTIESWSLLPLLHTTRHSLSSTAPPQPHEAISYINTAVLIQR